jgi:xylulokinase
VSCCIGIDLGTSALKAILVDEAERTLATADISLATTYPAPRAAEQDPRAWWQAAQQALAALQRAAPDAMVRVSAIGLSGQMHAALLLDATDLPVRPAMLWNDGRAHAEADTLKSLGAGLAAELGVPALANFTAPKLLWLARHEPQALARARCLLLPKDYLRLQLTGERATDPSDAAGTWLLDIARRAWSPHAVAAVGIDPAILPRLVEGSAPSGTLRASVATQFGLPPGTVVACGGGDTMAGGVGIGAVDDGQAFVGLSTSAQLFVAANAYRPAPAQFVHAYCHALPARWCQMAAMLNGAGVLAGIAHLLGDAEVGALLAEVEKRFSGPSNLLVLPYLSGERTPHDDPHARGVIFGLTPDTSRLDLVQAAMEGVAFTFADARDALAAGGTAISSAGLVGGGARSRLWARLIASILGVPLRRYAGAARGPALGAARLARLALGSQDPSAILHEPPVESVVEPEAALAEAYAPRVASFRALYAALRPQFAAAGRG